MRLPGRVPCCSRLGAFLPRRIKGGLRSVDPVAGSVECFLGALAGGLGILQHSLSGGQPAARVG
jgi:hypothetical protein